MSDRNEMRDRFDNMRERAEAAEYNFGVELDTRKAAEAEVARLREALGVIADYYEAVYAPGDQAYQAAIVARAALGEDA